MSKKVSTPERFEFTKTEGEKKTKRYLQNPWSGSVTFCDPLLLPHAEAIEDWLAGKDEAKATDELKRTLPMLSACVEKWELANFPLSPTPETFPLSPKLGSDSLLSWLVGEILKIYYGELEVPNE